MGGRFFSRRRYSRRLPYFRELSTAGTEVQPVRRRRVQLSSSFNTTPAETVKKNKLTEAERLVPEQMLAILRVGFESREPLAQHLKA
jgi:hypothetical protein